VCITLDKSSIRTRVCSPVSTLRVLARILRTYFSFSFFGIHVSSSPSDVSLYTHIPLCRGRPARPDSIGDSIDSIDNHRKSSVIRARGKALRRARVGNSGPRRLPPTKCTRDHALEATSRNVVAAWLEEKRSWIKITARQPVSVVRSPLSTSDLHIDRSVRPPARSREGRTREKRRQRMRGVWSTLSHSR